MNDPDKLLEGVRQAGYPLDVFQRPDGKWEVTIALDGTPTTLYARATTRKAAIEHAARTIFPAIIAAAIARWWRNRQEAHTGVIEGRSSLSGLIRSTDAQEFGGSAS
jgi:hypothetical protein